MVRLNPRQFLDDFVLPTIAEWRDDSLNIRRAIFAIIELDNLAEHFIIHTLPQPTPTNAVGPKRDRIGGVVKAVGLCRDVHDTHKHGPLTRKSATIKSGQRPTQMLVGGAFQMGAFQLDAFQTGRHVLQIVEDDGTEHLIEDVIDSALAYWTAELTRIGL